MANIVNLAVLTGVVAAISIAMMQVTARELFPATSEAPAKAVAAPSPNAAWGSGCGR